MPRNHANFLTAYCEALTPRGEAPERFHFWTAVSTIAGCLRRRVYIDQGHFRHYPNFYICLVGPPGLIKKSTTINIGSNLLRDVPNVVIGADCSTWQAFVQEVAQAQDMLAEGAPAADPLDTTFTVTSALTLAISEFGTFFDPDDRQMVNVLTELYDGKVGAAFRKATKTQGDDTIMNPFVNIIAGTTPDWIKDNFKGRFGGWGLSSRIMFLHCDEKERSISDPGALWAGTYERTMQTFLADLCEIAQLQGTCVLTNAAKILYHDWYEEHGRRQTALNRHANHDQWLSYYLARKDIHIYKLAIILSVARRNDLVIDFEDISTAIDRCDEIEVELAKVFATRASASREVALNMDVWKGLCNGIQMRGGRIEEYQFMAFTIMYMSGGKAKELLAQLLASKWLLREQDGGVVYLTFGPQAQIPERKEEDERSEATDAQSSSDVPDDAQSLQRGTGFLDREWQYGE